MLVDISDFGKEHEIMSDRVTKILSSIDFDASGWQDKLTSIPVDLILVKKEIFLNLMQRTNQQLVESTLWMNLTKREKEILSLSAEGKLIKEMGVELKISEKTIKSHLGNIYSKLGVRSRTEAISWYYKRNYS